MANTPTVYPFPFSNGDDGYDIFPVELEADPLVAFHGTSESCLDSILEQGFKIAGVLPSISFAKNSSSALGYAVHKRNNDSRQGVVIAVRFESLTGPWVVEEISFIHVYCEDKQPKIIGYCIVPESYQHT